jgi:hypothetical protein
MLQRCKIERVCRPRLSLACQMRRYVSQNPRLGQFEHVKVCHILRLWTGRRLGSSAAQAIIGGPEDPLSLQGLNKSVIVLRRILRSSFLLCKLNRP